MIKRYRLTIPAACLSMRSNNFSQLLALEEFDVRSFFEELKSLSAWRHPSGNGRSNVRSPADSFRYLAPREVRITGGPRRVAICSSPVGVLQEGVQAAPSLRLSREHEPLGIPTLLAKR